MEFAQLNDLHHYLLNRYQEDGRKVSDYEDLVTYATSDPDFETLFERIFDEKDADFNKILNEDEWIEFCRGVYDLVEETNPLIFSKLLKFDAGMVRKFFYVFNLISIDHSGISMQKLIKAKDMYYFTTQEVKKKD